MDRPTERAREIDAAIADIRAIEARDGVTPASLEAIKGFAGEDVEVAKYYPEDKEFLLEFEPKVVHYEVVGQSE